MPLLASVALAALFAQAPLPHLREEGPPLSIAEARALPAPVLAARLLGPGSDPVVEAIVHPQGMEAPLSPRATEYTIDLVTAARLDRKDAFCRKRILQVLMEKGPDTGPDTLAGHPKAVSATDAYRLADRSHRPTAGCEGALSGYFRPSPGTATTEQALGWVLQLQKARDEARRGRKLAFAISFEDPYGEDSEKWKANAPAIPGAAPGPGPERFADARAALAALPLEQTNFVGDARLAENHLQPRDFVDPHGRTLAAVQFYIDYVWSVGMVTDGDRIVVLRIVRATPAPF